MSGVIGLPPEPHGPNPQSRREVLRRRAPPQGRNPVYGASWYRLGHPYGNARSIANGSNPPLRNIDSACTVPWAASLM